MEMKRTSLHSCVVHGIHAQEHHIREEENSHAIQLATLWSTRWPEHTHDVKEKNEQRHYRHRQWTRRKP